VEFGPDGNETVGNFLPNCPTGIEVVISFPRKFKMRLPCTLPSFHAAIVSLTMAARVVYS
jgi:hypothetical protein